MFILRIISDSKYSNIYYAAKHNPILALLHCDSALYYSKKVIKGRFELGEHIIATNDYCAYIYAIDILKGPFKLAEPILAQSEYYSYLYTHFVLRHDFYIDSKLIYKYNKHNVCY